MKLNYNKHIDVTIVIPVKNGGKLFEKVLSRIQRQKFDKTFEVICIDSGSTDNSQKIVKKYGYNLVKIKPSEFGHGKTRNYGASIGSGEFIVYLTHDAIPANNRWLSELVKPLIEDKKVAGSFSRHIAHVGASPFLKWELDKHFDNLKKFMICEISKVSDYHDNISIQQTFHFFSNNSSCLRRSVWLKYPFPDVQFAEDQIWAKKILEQGYKKAYSYASIIHHSHDFGPIETLKRCFDESRALKVLFGYNLSNNLFSVIKTGFYLCIRDLTNAVKFKWFKTHFSATLSIFVKSFTRPLGYYLGTKENLPVFFKRKLSIDEWIKNL